MKILHMNFVPENLLGVKRKLLGQTEALRKNGNTVVVGEYNKLGYTLGDDQIFALGIRNRLFRKFFEAFILFKLLRKISCEFDYIYIRYMRLTPWFFFFLKSLHKKGFKIIIEVPTYPYDQEYSNGMLSYSDAFFRRRLYKYVLGITYIGASLKSIWGIPALAINNGIDVDNLKLSNGNRKTRTNSDEINFIGVANLADWHAYDRFIKSMSHLDTEVLSKVKFHIVGNGEALSYLQGLVKELELSKNVFFYGNKSGKELDNIFDSCQIGVASLGLYRIGHDFITPLKPAEYTARGLPFLLGNSDERFLDANFKYQLDNDDTTFDIKYILNWYHDLDFSPSSLRNYAIHNLSWETQMKKVDDFYNALVGDTFGGDDR